MTLVTKATGASIDATLPLVVPGFDLDVPLTHYYHPQRFADAGTSWADEVGSIPLPVVGDTSATQETEESRPMVRLTTAASLFPGLVFDTDEVRTIGVIAKIATGDDKAGSSGYVLHNGASGIAMNTLNSATVTLTNGASGATAQIDKWHLFTITTPEDGITRFTVDDNDFTASTPAVLDPRTIRIGSNTSGNHKAMTVAAAFSCSELAALDITGTLWDAVQEWWPDLDWAT